MDAGKVEIRVAQHGEHRAIAKVKVCEMCGEFRGEVYYPESKSITRVLCLCEGSLCTKCKTRRIFRRGKEMMDKKGNIWHMPWFASLCPECRKDMEPECVKQAEERERVERERRVAEAKAAGLTFLLDVLDGIVEDSCFIGGPYSEE